MDENAQTRFDDWTHKKVYTVVVPFSNIMSIYNHITNRKKYKYKWEYDNSVMECDCKATYNSPPYCIHFNKLTRKKLNETY